jgi:hypothetical protein
MIKTDGREFLASSMIERKGEKSRFCSAVYGPLATDTDNGSVDTSGVEGTSGIL